MYNETPPFDELIVNAEWQVNYHKTKLAEAEKVLEALQSAKERVK